MAIYNLPPDSASRSEMTRSESSAVLKSSRESEPGILVLLDQLSLLADGVSKATEQLRDRLSPVLVDRPCQGQVRGNEKNTSACSPVEMRLLGIIEELESVFVGVAAMTERVRL